MELNKAKWKVCNDHEEIKLLKKKKDTLESEENEREKESEILKEKAPTLEIENFILSEELKVTQTDEEPKKKTWVLEYNLKKLEDEKKHS